MKYFERGVTIFLLCLFFAGLGYAWRVYHEGGLWVKEKAVWDRLTSHEIRLDLIEKGMVMPKRGQK